MRLGNNLEIKKKSREGSPSSLPTSGVHDDDKSTGQSLVATLAMVAERGRSW
jgi:hypothetical protein